MATYISTINFTEQGVKAVRETTKRATAFKAIAKKMKTTLTSIYWTLGAFDGALVFDAPDDESATALMLSLGMQGNVQTTTVRAFAAPEMDKILEKMSG
jgi:uncharacterized protein with GYD domain